MVDDYLSDLIEMLRVIYGKSIDLYESTFLLNVINAHMNKLAQCTPTEYYTILKNTPVEANKLFKSLNITYSVFFRDVVSFSVLEYILLPRLIKDRKKLRIWVAGCSSGQEAYSVALLLRELSDAPKRFRIFATDYSEDELRAAEKGMYYADALQNMQLKYLDKYFENEGSFYFIQPSVKEMVEFSNFDILDERLNCPPSSIYGSFDMVFCSNILFYYNSNVRKVIIQKMYNALAVGGYFVTSDSEKDMIMNYKGLEYYMTPLPIFRKSR
jgi:chemotaxis protein methyltransferase CheR